MGRPYRDQISIFVTRAYVPPGGNKVHNADRRVSGMKRADAGLDRLIGIRDAGYFCYPTQPFLRSSR